MMVRTLCCLITATLLLAAALTCPGNATATSKELCEQKVQAAVLSDKIRDSPTAAIRDVTDQDLQKLRRVMLSQCMLSAEELSTNWDGKSASERAAFFNNYTRISGIVTESLFNTQFPNRNAAYTHEVFLKSAMAFPMLCGEEGQTDETCKREFATMFAHWMQETSGLQYLTEGSCTNGGCASYLDKKGYFYNQYVDQDSPNPEYQYWGRGPKQLSYNGNYGRFSWGFLGGGSSSSSFAFLERPSLLLDNAYINMAFVNAFWFYMTPISQKPSMHEVVTGLWQPNSLDQAANITPGFGATINIINGAVDCNKSPSESVQNRIAFYQGGTAQGASTPGTLAAFGLQPLSGEVTGCENMQVFPSGGSGTYPLYFNMNQWSQCELYVNENLFTVYDQTPLHTLGNSLCSNGLDCCRTVQPKLAADNTDLPPMALDALVTWLGGIPLDLKANSLDTSLDRKANSLDTSLKVSRGQPITFSFSLAPGDKAGESVDLWLVAWSLTESKWYVYDPAQRAWLASQSLRASGQYKLVPLDHDKHQVVVQTPQAGEFFVYFAVDRHPNGRVDPNSLAWDRIKVHIE